MKEALEWLQSSYLFCRLKKNPFNYGLSHAEIAVCIDKDDNASKIEKIFHYNFLQMISIPSFLQQLKLKKIICNRNHFFQEGLEYDFLQRQLVDAAKVLEKAEMIRYDDKTGELRPTSYGRIASYLYITHETITLFMEKMHRHMMDDEILFLISSAIEFQQIQVRNDELDELDRLRSEYVEVEVNLDVSSVEMKVMVLIQTCISKGFIRLSSLVSDSEYIMQVHYLLFY